MVANLHIQTRIMKKKALIFVNLVELFTTVNNMREDQERIFPKNRVITGSAL